MMIAVIIAIGLALAGPAESQTISGPALKAAFLFNFVKFAEWPVDAMAPGEPLSLCVLGDDAVAGALRQTITGQTVGDRKLTVYTVKADGPLQWCRLLYVGNLDLARFVALLDSFQAAPVFTVGDADRFAAQGGVAQLIVEDGRVRFAINVAAAQRARLALSSRLLSLATIVKDAHHVKP
jgi:hypothetical protein